VSGTAYPRIASFKTPEAFRTHLRALGLNLDLDDAVDAGARSPLAQPFEIGPVRVGNRFCILPMEGWDGSLDGRPSDLTRRRWRNFAISGAKLIWGGEAVAVRQDGRANPHQLLLTPANAAAIADLRESLVSAHRERFGPNADGDLYVGLQLTHSGRYSRPAPSNRHEPLAAYAHPILDRRFAGGVRVLTDDEIDRLVEDVAAAARLAWDAGFAFVDVKQCHGYLGHELLSAHDRPGRYGGSIVNRTRFLRSIIEAIRTVAPGLAVAVRLSVFDTVPFRKRPDGRGEPELAADDYHAAFGLLRDDMHGALADAREVLALLNTFGVRLISVSAGSPYYNPHLQRPALFPPSDGYEPPEDPLVGVARQIDATARLKADFPSMVFVGSAYSYLQEWLPHVAQHSVRTGMTDFVGLGRMVLAYPELPADVLAGHPLQRKRICRTFSDCTTGPRLGLVSGCYPLDEFYKSHADAVRLKEMKDA
jgi:2,4-dienoyl-CoA reductase-like NADH-dependent reductase (Old Yellow Enzyme family)